MDDEILDLVDRDDNVIGTINRMDYNHLVTEKLGYLRAVHLFLVNSCGQVFTPVRTADKTIAPGGFDYSAGGHVGAGETYLTSVLREAKEELDLDLTSDDLEPLEQGVLEDIRYIHHTFVVHGEETPEFNPNDFVSAQWMEPMEIIRQIDAGHPAKGSLRGQIQVLEKYLSNVRA